MCVRPIIPLKSVALDNWDAETCSGVVHRGVDASGTPVRTHLSKLLSAETVRLADGLR